MNIETAIRQHVTQLAEKLSIFKDTGYSFEEWINWELFYAITKAGLIVTPKPTYQQFSNESGEGLGDLLVAETDFIEIGLVHDFTANKWLAKIEGDHKALNTLKSSKVNPIQILVLVSKYEDLENYKTWSSWLNSISFWHNPTAWTIKSTLPTGGQVVIKCWQLSS